jgi:hypothetical protein
MRFAIHKYIMRFLKCCALPENHHSTQKYRSLMYPERKTGFMILDSPSYVTTNFFCAKEISSARTECHSMSNPVQPMMSTTLVASINIAWWLMFDPKNIVGINCSVGKQAGYVVLISLMVFTFDESAR